MSDRLPPSSDLSPGSAMFQLCADLFPMCRSVAGPGVRETLQHLQTVIPLDICEVPSGTKVFDWEVPREWSIRDAYIKDSEGRRVIDFKASNLHVVNGSVAVNQRMSWSDLSRRLHTLPDRPSWIPYRTCYYSEDWGFCLTHEQYQQLESLGNRSYDVCIDSSLTNGSMSYGELYLPGMVNDEILITTHVCHPSMANDNLSGIAVAACIAKIFAQRKRRHSFRFLFIPATIGAITWLSLNESRVHRIKHGLVLSVVGDAGAITYKKSREDAAAVDRAMQYVLSRRGLPFTIQNFTPLGYDQRQFCSPGFNLPMGCLMRTPNGEYPEYHTSADNLDFIRPESLEDSLSVCTTVLELLEGNESYLNLNPKCEPRLGPRGLYQAFGRGTNRKALQEAVLWVLNFSDGNHDLLDICQRSNLDFQFIRQAADLLLDHQLLAVPLKTTRTISQHFPMEEARHEHCLL